MENFKYNPFLKVDPFETKGNKLIDIFREIIKNKNMKELLEINIILNKKLKELNHCKLII
jgi:hypothetical protein